MIIVGGAHALRGREARLHQFCNDWLSVEIPAAGDAPAEARILGPTQVLVDQAELDRIVAAGDRAGTFWREFEAQPQADGMFRFVRRRAGAHRRRGSGT